MAENSNKNQLILDECIGLTSCPHSVQSILCDPERKRKTSMLYWQFKGAFCAAQSSQATSFVLDVCREEFVSTFHLPSRRTVRRRLMFGSDNMPITTNDSFPVLSISLLAV